MSRSSGRECLRGFALINNACKSLLSLSLAREREETYKYLGGAYTRSGTLPHYLIIEALEIHALLLHG